MTRREKSGAGDTRRGESTEASTSATGGNSSAHAADSAGADAAKARGSANPDAHSRLQRIALVTVDRLDREALCFTLSACERMTARLDILTNLSPADTDRALVAARGTADTPWRVIPVGDDMKGEIFGYARNEPGLLFLASGIGDEVARKLRDRFASEGVRPGIPWVVVEGKRRSQ